LHVIRGSSSGSTQLHDPLTSRAPRLDRRLALRARFSNTRGGRPAQQSRRQRADCQQRLAGKRRRDPLRITRTPDHPESMSRPDRSGSGARLDDGLFLTRPQWIGDSATRISPNGGSCRWSNGGGKLSSASPPQCSSCCHWDKPRS
jgi:hypothetical protein